MSSASKSLKLKSSHDGVSMVKVPSPPPESFIGCHGRGRHHRLPNNPYASPDSPNSPLIGYLLSGIGRPPLASVENLLNATPPARSPTVFKAPMISEEDVLVMDGILVGPKIYITSRLRSSLTSSYSGSRSSSSGCSENNSSNTNNIFHKTDTCQSWDESDAKCLAQICKAYSSSRSCTYGTKSTVSPTHHHVPPAIAMAETVSLIEFHHPTSSRSSNPTGFTSTDWSPMDDGIEVTLTSYSSLYTEDVDVYIQRVLYGSAVRKRLQVFAEICVD